MKGELAPNKSLSTTTDWLLPFLSISIYAHLLSSSTTILLGSPASFGQPFRPFVLGDRSPNDLPKNCLLGDSPPDNLPPED